MFHLSFHADVTATHSYLYKILLCSNLTLYFKQEANNNSL